MMVLDEVIYLVQLPKRLYIDLARNKDSSVMIFLNIVDDKVVNDWMLKVGLPYEELISSEGSQGQHLIEVKDL